MQKITIKDLAKMANVSAATVSMVLNNKAKISPATRDKIKQLAEKHNYIPNVAARGLVCSKTNTLGILISDLGEPINSATVKAISKKMSGTNYEIVLYDSHKSTDWREKLYHQINNENRLDGILHKAYNMTDADRPFVETLRVPLVVFENELNWIDCVAIDNYKSTKIAAQYLINQGHKKIGIVSCCIGDIVMNCRTKSITNTMDEMGLTFDPQHFYQVKEFLPQEGKLAADYFHSLSNKPSAIFVVAGDYIASGLIFRTKELGYRIPDDFAVIGYDDLWFASYLDPPLTTLRQPLDEMASEGIDLLIARINDNKKPPETRKFKLDLVIRQST